MHATAFLKQTSLKEFVPVAVLAGNEQHLKRACLEALCQFLLGPDENDLGVTRFSGRDVDLKTVCDELRTVSLWGDSRIVVIDEADDFVSGNRAGLEKYVQQPAKRSLLVLDVKSWPKNTRLAKLVAQVGLPVECSELKGAALLRWVSETGRAKYGKSVEQSAARLLVELSGNHLGQLDQELSKLTAYVGDRSQIGPDDVRTLVGGWKLETTWAMTNAVRDGNLGLALEYLDKLMIAGEAPQKILGGITFVFRKLAQATELARQGQSLDTALQNAGVFPRDISPSAGYLRRIGRPRAERLLGELVSADSHLKGASRLVPRVQLEHLLVQLSGQVS